MSVLAHSELMKVITGIEEGDIEKYFLIMSRHTLTDLRYNCLRRLAHEKRATVSMILKEIGETTSGGTYVTIENFFKSMEKEGILAKEQVGSRHYWSFSDKAAELAKYIALG